MRPVRHLDSHKDVFWYQTAENNKKDELSMHSPRKPDKIPFQMEEGIATTPVKAVLMERRNGSRKEEDG